MNRFVQIGSVILGILASTNAAQAQEQTSDTTRRNTQILSDTTRREVREAGQQVKEAAREVNRDVDRATTQAGRGVRETIDRVNRNELDWFQRGSSFGGISLGYGPGDDNGSYLIFNPRFAYFVQRGLALGIKLGFESRTTTSYRASLGGPFIRFYPVRNRFFVFGEGGLNFGRYRTSILGPDDKRGFSSINIGAGVGVWALSNLGLELMYDHNYYDKTPEFAGRNRGPQIKLGASFHLVPRSARRSTY